MRHKLETMLRDQISSLLERINEDEENEDSV